MMIRFSRLGQTSELDGSRCLDSYPRMFGILSNVLRVPQSSRSKKARLCHMRRRGILDVKGSFSRVAL